MGVFSTHVGDMGLRLAYGNVRLIDGVSEVRIKDNKLQAKIDDKVEQDKYETISKQISTVYGFCFKNVYSEKYQVTTPTAGFHYSGHEMHKLELLTRRYRPTKEFVQSAHQLCADMLSKPLEVQQRVILFNHMAMWNKAYELQQLHLSVEAQVLLVAMIDGMKRDQPIFTSDTLVSGLGIIATDADIFAARILLAHEREKKPTAKDELEGFSYVYRLRLRQGALLDASRQLYIDSKIAPETERRNSPLFEIIRLYIIWLAGLQQYYLNSQASRFKIQRSKTG